MNEHVNQAQDPPSAAPTDPPPPTQPPAAASEPSALRRWLPRLLVLALLVAGGVVIQKTLLAPDPVRVHLIPIEVGKVEQTVTNSRAGTVRARRRAKLSPEISGQVVEIAKREGARVEKGDLLLRLRDDSQQARLLLAKQALATTRAQSGEARVRAGRAQRELTRKRELAKKDIISADVLDQLENALEAAKAAQVTAAARVEQARAEVKLAEAELNKTRLVAPFAGILAEVSADVGEWITPAPPMMPVPAVLDLIDPASIYISAPMDEVDSAVIRKEQRVRVTLDPHPGKTFPGRVVRVAAYVEDREAQNRTVELEVSLDDQTFAATLLPGTSADVEVVIQSRDGVLRIPTGTLFQRRKVLLVEEGLLVERMIQTGLKNWNYTEVLSGLKQGERIVSNLDRAEVKAGARATIHNPTKP